MFDGLAHFASQYKLNDLWKSGFKVGMCVVISNGKYTNFDVS